MPLEREFRAFHLRPKGSRLPALNWSDLEENMNLTAAATMLFALATGAGAAGFTPQTERPSSLITTVRCLQQNCYSYEQWNRPGFNRNKERPDAGPGHENEPKRRALEDCLKQHMAHECHVKGL